MPKTPTLVAWSGGKDAAWALHALRRSADCEPVALLSTITEGRDEVAMHGIGLDVLDAQADAVGLPVIESWQPPDPDNATYEASFAAALALAGERWPGLRRIAFGDILLADVRAFRDALCARHGWTAVYPLFGRDTRALAREMVAGGLRARLCCVDTTRLDGDFAGRDYDAALLDELPPGIDPCGERGEFHTCAYDGPMFARPLRLERGETVLRDGRFLCTDLLLS